MSDNNAQPAADEAASKRSVWLQALPALTVAAMMLVGAVWVYVKGQQQRGGVGPGGALQGQSATEALRRGRSYVELGLHRDAVPYLRAAQAAAPDDPEVHHLLGAALAGTGGMDEALPHLEKAALARPDAEAYHAELAKAYRKLGRYGKAREACLQALECNPSNAEVHNELGFIYGRQRLYSEARLHFRTALKLDPDNRVAKMNLEVLRKLPDKAPPQKSAPSKEGAPSRKAATEE